MPDEREAWFAWVNNTAVPPRVEAGPKHDGEAVFIGTPDPDINRTLGTRERAHRVSGTNEQEAYVDARIYIESMGKQMIIVPCPDAARDVAQKENDIRNEASNELVASAFKNAVESVGIELTPEQLETAFARFKNEVDNAQLDKDMRGDEDPPMSESEPDPNPTPDVGPHGEVRELEADAEPMFFDPPSPPVPPQPGIDREMTQPEIENAYREASPMVQRMMGSFPWNIQASVDAPTRSERRASASPGTAPVPGVTLNAAKDANKSNEKNMRRPGNRG